MQKNENKHINIDAAFFTKLAQMKVTEDKSALLGEYHSYIHFTDWVIHHLVFPFDEKIQLTAEEVKEMILDSYISYPFLSLEQRKEYVLGLAIVEFSEKKVQNDYLCRDTQELDVMYTLSSFPADFHTPEVLLAIKDSISVAMQEHQYCIA